MTIQKGSHLAAYIQPGFVPGTVKPKVLEKDVFDQVIEAIPRVCADVVFFNRADKVVYLAIRREHPMGPYIFGGGLQIFEPEIAAIIRRLEVEIGFSFDQDRFELVWWMRRYMFATFDGFCNLYQLEVTAEEVSNMVLCNQEFVAEGGVQPYTLADLERLKDQEGREHEGQIDLLIEMYRAVFKRKIIRKCLRVITSFWSRRQAA